MSVLGPAKVVTWEELEPALELTEIGPGRFTGRGLDIGVGRIPGAPLLALSVLAAERCHPGRAVQTLHGVFPRGGLLEKPLEIAVDDVQAGAALATTQVSFTQEGREHCRVLTMLSAPEEDYLRHQAAVPEELLGPDGCEAFVHPRIPWETRIEGGADALIADGRRTMDVWMRCKSARPTPVMSRALLAHACELLVGPAALRGFPLREREARGGDGARFVLSQSISFHEEFDLGDWVLMRAENVHVGNGRMHTRIQTYAGGVLVASSSGNGLLRAR